MRAGPRVASSPICYDLWDGLGIKSFPRGTMVHLGVDLGDDLTNGPGEGDTVRSLKSLER